MPDEFDEALHPRADDGKFGAGGGGKARSSKAADTVKKGKAISSARAHAASPAREHDSHRDTVAHGYDGDQLKPAAQRAARAMVQVDLEKHGVKARGYGTDEDGTRHNETRQHEVVTMSSEEMGCMGGRSVSGLIYLDRDVTKALVAHSAEKDLHEVGRRAMAGDSNAMQMMSAHLTLVHEQVHGSGPDFDPSGHGLMAEEMITEVASRHITGQIHNVDASDLAGSYDNYIRPVVAGIAQTAGVSEKEAFNALAAASLRHKQGDGETMASAADKMADVAYFSLEHLGVDPHSAASPDGPPAKHKAQQIMNMLYQVSSENM